MAGSFSADPGAPPLAAHRTEIDRCFGAPSVTAVLAALKDEKSAWAEEQLQIIAAKSPMSLAVTYRQIQRGRKLQHIEQVMAMEYRLAVHFYRGHDFFEGTRALIIDKDGAPEWRPASLAEISEAEIEAYFDPVAGEPCFELAVRNN